MSVACSRSSRRRTSAPLPTSVPLLTSPTSPLLLRVCAARTGVINVTGDLDLSTRDLYMAVATAGHHPAVVIDLAGCTFMDCSGYGSLVASRLAIEGDGRSLTITGQTGQPARLWKLIAEMESGHGEP